MTKAEFFKYCASAEEPEKYRLRVDIQTIPREKERAVFLYGCWHRHSTTMIQLYCPFPGRQWAMRKTFPWEPACEKAKQKFERWLLEFQRLTTATESDC